MPWTEKDYPDSMKNLDSIVKRKAIDIANAMIKDGYKESNAIPIAISQAKEWAKDASLEDKTKLQKKDITNHQKNTKQTSSRLQNKDVEVKYDENDEKWEVITKGAKKADSKYSTKKEAEDRAKEIAANKNAEVISHKKSQ